MGKLRANSEIISDKSKNPVTTSTYIKHGNQWLDDAVNNAIGAAASKADKTYVDSELTKKANKSDTDAALSSKADKSALEAINASVSANTSNIQGLSTESTVLSARMDEFTKLEEGSTTGDAELADGRVGADGKTYDNIGGAIRGQVTDLKSDLNQLDGDMQTAGIVADVFLNDMRVTGFVKANGLFSTNTDWNRTDYIPVYKQFTLSLDNALALDVSVGYNIAYFDKNKVLVSGFAFENEGAFNKTYNVPNGVCYIIVSNPVASNSDNDYARTFVDNGLNEMKISLSNLEDSLMKHIDLLSLYVDGFVKADGTINTSNTDWHRTDYIPVARQFTLTMGNACGLSETVGWNIAFFDENKNFVSGISFGKDGVFENTYSVPNDVRYVVVTNNKSYTTENEFIVTFGKENNANYIVVDKNGKGDFTTVTDAVNSAVDGDVIFVKSGDYTNEHIQGWGKTLSIIGENPLNTILSCDDNTYENPTLEFSVGVLKNLTIKRNNVDGSGYAFHCEDDYQFNKSLFVENCIFVSPKGNSVGMGMRGGCKIVFKDCQFLNTENQGSCFYLHDADEEQYKGTFDIDFVNCLFSNLGNYIMSLQSQEVDGSIINFGFVNCRFYGNGSHIVPYIATTNYDGGVSTNSADWNGLINWRLKATSNGNNLTALNTLPTYSGIATN